MYNTLMIVALTVLGNPAPETPAAADTTSPHGLSVGVSVGSKHSTYFPEHTEQDYDRVEFSGLDRLPAAEVSLNYHCMFEASELRLGFHAGFAALEQDDGAFEHTYTSIPLIGTFEWAKHIGATPWTIAIGLGGGAVWNQSTLEAGQNFISESASRGGKVVRAGGAVQYALPIGADIGLEYQFQMEARVTSHTIALTTDYLIFGGN